MPPAPARQGDAAGWQQGIPFKYDGNGGIFTMVDAVNATLGLGEPASAERLIADQVF